MTIKEALSYWKFKYNRAKDYYDKHWEADERREHEEYVEALRIAVKALEENAELKRLLKMAIEDMKNVSDHNNCYKCIYWNPATEICGEVGFNVNKNSLCYKWRHADEAMKLIGGEENDCT